MALPSQSPENSDRQKTEKVGFFKTQISYFPGHKYIALDTSISGYRDIKGYLNVKTFVTALEQRWGKFPNQIKMTLERSITGYKGFLEDKFIQKDKHKSEAVRNTISLMEDLLKALPLS